MVHIKQLREWLFGRPIRNSEDVKEWIRQTETLTGVMMPQELRMRLIRRYEPFEQESPPIPFLNEPYLRISGVHLKPVRISETEFVLEFDPSLNREDELDTLRAEADQSLNELYRDTE